MATYLSFPQRVLWGSGSIQKLAEEVRLAGGLRVLLVSDPGLVATGLVDRAVVLLDEAKLEVLTFSQLSSNPKEAEVWYGVEAFRTHRADVIVAMGGGAAIDLARAVRLAIHHEPPLSRYDDAEGGDALVTRPLPPMIAIPTTAGTGSEVSRSAVIHLEDTARKTVLFSPRLMATSSILDPELTLRLPPEATAWTGMDAFTHCLEAYLALGRQPMADALAIDGIRLVSQALPAAVGNGTDLAARSDMMAAAMFGGLALTKGLGAAHALSHALGAVADLHHGLANAIVLPWVCRFNEPLAHPRFARIAEAMGEEREGRSDRELADRACERIDGLCRKVGIPARLSEVGVVPNMIPAVVEKALADASHRTNPRPCTAEDFNQLLQAMI